MDYVLQHKAYQFRLYPSQKQKVLIAKTIGCCRFVYNHFLDKWNTSYAETGKGLSYNACSAELPAMKKAEETDWLKEVDSIALQSSVRHLADSFSRFFTKQNGKPRFKSKKNPVQSYKTKYVNNNISIEGNRLILPKLGFLRFSKSRTIKGRIINATIRYTPSGKYFVSILCEEEIQPLPKSGTSVGIDLGITHFATLSDGQKIDNNRFTRKMEKQLKKEQRKLSRRALIAKKKGINLFEAKNYQKQRRKVAKLHDKVMNQHTDFLNKLSTATIKNHDVICIEDLNTKDMLKNHKLAKGISDVSWSRFEAQLAYKAKWYGKQVIKIDRWYPSSQLCSECGHRDGKKNLTIRAWICPSCHIHHDRDINASKNILAEGLRQVT